MSTIHLHSNSIARQLPRHEAAVDALSDATDWAFAAIREWTRRIRERRQLAGLDDRMLHDIGITRADAVRLGGKPFWRE
ncbi:MAG TPA: DUF1127 domain-containing protein [Stellaceae bacterium]|jgi:uncharacterized protein YjiS (DUF1127 family)|nr:DUF1127 domain-containing protein [Stellaceae bacterium]